MREKKQKKRIGLGCLALVAMVVIAVFAIPMFSKPQTVFATELKLQTFDSLDGLSLEALTSPNGVQQYIMPVVEGSLSAMNYTLSSDERNALVADIVKRLKAEVEAGNIEFGDDGNLTDLSKGYVSNAVADSVSYILPTIDMESTVNGGSEYSQIINMQNTLVALEASNQSLSNTIELVNDAMKSVTASQQAQIGTIDSTLTERMDALYTELLAKITYNTKTGKQLTSDVRDIQDILDELSRTQQQTLDKLATATANLQELSESMDKLQQSNSSFQANFKEITQQIEQVRKTLASTQNDFSTSQTENVRNLTEQFNTQIENLTVTMNSGLTALETQLNTNVTEIRTYIDESNSKAAADLAQVQTELNSKIELTRVELNNTITTKITNLSSELANTKSELQSDIDKKYAELTKQDDALKDQMTADKAELNATIEDLRTELTTEINAKYTELSNTINQNFQTLEKKDAELAAAIEKARKDLTDALDTAKADLTSQIESVINDLEQTKQKLNDTSESLADLTLRVTAAEAEITNIQNQIATVISTYDAAVQELWAQVNTNTADVAAIRARLNAFILSADSHYKVDVIPGFSIATGDWRIEDDTAVFTITHKFAKNCSVVEVNYAQQYDITPVYSADDSIGKITISIPASQVQDIAVSGITCYHLVSDDAQPDASGQKAVDEKPVVSEEEENTNIVDAEITAHTPLENDDE